MKIDLPPLTWAALALLLTFGYSTRAVEAQTSANCQAPPYNVPAGQPTSATTAVQDQAHMMCIQGLQFPTAASNPPLSATRFGDPYAPVNIWPGTITSASTVETSNWTDALSHTVVRWGWGGWTTYDDSQSGGTASVLCGAASENPPYPPGCTAALQKSTATGGSMSGFGDYGPADQTSGGHPIAGARPYPTGTALVGLNGNTICTSPGCLAAGHYTPIDIFTMKDGTTKIASAKDWWLKRRPELFDLVQKEMYGYKIPAGSEPAITWTISAVTTGTQAGTLSCITPVPQTTPATCSAGTVADPSPAYPFKAVTYTGTISTAQFPAVRNAPVIVLSCRFPAGASSPVPTFIGIAGSATLFQYTAPLGFGACGYANSGVQADAGGAATSSYVSGLLTKGDYRQPTDPGTLQIWAWGVSKSIDELAADPDHFADADKIAVEGHSRDGKATLVTAAMDDRVVAALPSCGGAGGTAPIRRHFGESIESIVGNGEYYWMAGNLMNYAGAACQTNPNVGAPGCTPAYFPRKVEELDVDAPEVVSLIAPRAVMTNGGTDTPAGNGDAWQDPRGMYLSGAIAGPVWQLLGWPGQVIPAGTTFTSNPTSLGNGESIGGTPPFNVAFIDGTVAWRRHSQGHTDVPEWPVFVTFASKYLNDVRPVITPGQVFTLPASGSTAVGAVDGTNGGGGRITNWQIKGGTGAYAFDIDSDTGNISIADRTQLNGASTYTLVLMASDGILPTHDTTVTIKAPAAVNGAVQLITTTSLAVQTDGSYLGTVTVTNKGTGTANNVVLTGAMLGSANGTPAMLPLISIPPNGGVAVATVAFPASAGAPGATVVEKLSGTYTGGTFGGSLRAILP